jgi:urease accessory protein
MNSLRLLQVTDSAFPLGGYAFSSGLESMVQMGLIRDAAALVTYVRNVLGQVTAGDVPFINQAFTASARGYDDLEPVFRLFDAFLTVPTARKASVTQGRALLTAIQSAYPNHSVTDFRNWLKRRQLEPHLAPTYGFVARRIGLTHEQAVKGYCFMSIRDQVYAAVRLGILGPLEAQRILGELLAEIDVIAVPALKRECHESFKSCAVLEIAQVHHSRLYSRLFQS